MLFTLDPGQTVASFNNINIIGLSDGESIQVERAEDAYTMHSGRDGDITRVRNRNRSGSVTFTIVQGSPTNDALSAIALADENEGTGVGSLLIKDLQGTTLYKATEAWIRKIPTGVHGKEQVNRVWVIDCAELKMFVGGVTSLLG